MASVVTGELKDTRDKVGMLIAGTPNGTELWFEDSNGQAIKLTGAEVDAFCKADAASIRSCDLVPVTKVNKSDTSGSVQAIIRFQIVYQ
ncbi:hypothetical protein DCF83_14915 [Edwardsiella tarda]|uniref:hypothetical protein n=1 Tax=Edwardsiella tarda TaxID=636 RepID=UPI0011B24319|nr:hypothetical protein [Edwardsiella tarda]UCQ27283.1 hypothetical protein DCF83_14915 [Edwardsiella tarda]